MICVLVNSWGMFGSTKIQLQNLSTLERIQTINSSESPIVGKTDLMYHGVWLVDSPTRVISRVYDCRILPGTANSEVELSIIHIRLLTSADFMSPTLK